MALPISLINNTGSAILLDDLGITLDPGPGTIRDITGIYLPEELRQSEDLQAFAAVSGDVTISGSDGLLSPAQAQRFFDGSQMSEQIFTVDGFDLRSMRNNAVIAGSNIVVVSGVDGDGLTTFTIETGSGVLTNALVGAGGITVASGVNFTTVSGNSPAPGGQAAGAIYQLVFLHEGSDATDRWYSHHGDTSLTSDKSPAVVPWDSKLVALTFTNQDSDSDVNIEIYSVHEANTTQKDVEFVWVLRNARVARRTNFSPDILFEAGDRVAIYARDKGSNPDYTVVTLYLQILTDNSEEVIRSFSGDLSVGGTPDTD